MVIGVIWLGVIAGLMIRKLERAKTAGSNFFIPGLIIFVGGCRNQPEHCAAGTMLPLRPSPTTGIADWWIARSSAVSGASRARKTHVEKRARSRAEDRRHPAAARASNVQAGAGRPPGYRGRARRVRCSSSR